ncbi:hypothetical protein CP532_4375 [Ophiocordyceps camponoti-leonardi (nom. inval.)]|nr:hypothetical protein CP532_4375 [Ophiocordyceps camponoti-leonardi (nom. inval.)]
MRTGPGDKHSLAFDGVHLQQSSKGIGWAPAADGTLKSGRLRVRVNYPLLAGASIFRLVRGEGGRVVERSQGGLSGVRVLKGDAFGRSSRPAPFPPGPCPDPPLARPGNARRKAGLMSESIYTRDVPSWRREEEKQKAKEGREDEKKRKQSQVRDGKAASRAADTGQPCWNENIHAIRLYREPGCRSQWTPSMNIVILLLLLLLLPHVARNRSEGFTNHSMRWGIANWAELSVPTSASEQSVMIRSCLDDPRQTGDISLGVTASLSIRIRPERLTEEETQLKVPLRTVKVIHTYNNCNGYCRSCLKPLIL